MMLVKEHCEACQAGAPAVPPEDRSDLLKEIPDWQLIDEGTVPKLQRTFKFKNFVQALEFTNMVGQCAEQEDHHPALLTEWGKVTVTWWTHKIKNLHRNDFIMAAKCDKLFNGGGWE